MAEALQVKDKMEKDKKRPFDVYFCSHCKKIHISSKRKKVKTNGKVVFVKRRRKTTKPKGKCIKASKIKTRTKRDEIFKYKKTL